MGPKKGRGGEEEKILSVLRAASEKAGFQAGESMKGVRTPSRGTQKICQGPTQLHHVTVQ